MPVAEVPTRNLSLFLSDSSTSNKRNQYQATDPAGNFSRIRFFQRVIASSQAVVAATHANKRIVFGAISLSYWSIAASTRTSRKSSRV